MRGVTDLRRGARRDSLGAQSFTIGGPFVMLRILRTQSRPFDASFRNPGARIPASVLAFATKREVGTIDRDDRLFGFMKEGSGDRSIDLKALTVQERVSQQRLTLLMYRFELG